MLFLGPSSAKTIINFETFQLVALFITSVGLSQPYTVIGEDEKIWLARKAHKVNGAHQIHRNKLLRLLGTFLKLTIIHFGCFDSVTAVTDIVIGVINKRNFKAT